WKAAKVHVSIPFASGQTYQRGGCVNLASCCNPLRIGADLPTGLFCSDRRLQNLVSIPFASGQTYQRGKVLDIGAQAKKSFNPLRIGADLPTGGGRLEGSSRGHVSIPFASGQTYQPDVRCSR